MLWSWLDFKTVSYPHTLTITGQITRASQSLPSSNVPSWILYFTSCFVSPSHSTRSFQTFSCMRRTRMDDIRGCFVPGFQIDDKNGQTEQFDLPIRHTLLSVRTTWEQCWLYLFVSRCIRCRRMQNHNVIFTLKLLTYLAR